MDDKYTSAYTGPQIDAALASWLAQGVVEQIGAVTGTIPSGANLNTFTSFGNYSISTAAIASSLVNSPSTTAGVLRVYSGNGGGGNLYLVQDYCTRFGEVSTRYTADGGSTWTAWTTTATRDYVADTIYRSGTNLAGTEQLKSLAVGRYNAGTNSIGAALAAVATTDGVVNCPTANSFALWVFNRISGRSLLVLVDRLGDIYIRTQQTGEVYTAWKKITSTVV